MKPQGAAELMKTHPLSVMLTGAYLLNESGGVFKNRGINQHSPKTPGANTDLVSGAAGFNGGRPCQLGLGCRFDGTGYITGANPTFAFGASTGLTAGWSLAIKFRIATVQTGGIVSIGPTATSANPCYLLQCNSVTNIRVLLGNKAFQVIQTSPTAGDWYTVISTFTALLSNGITGVESHYLGYGSSATLAFTAALTTNVSSANILGPNIYLASGFSAAFPCDIEYCYVWDRCLTYQEALSLTVDPYQMWDQGPFSAVGKSAASTFQAAWATSSNSSVLGGVA
jgi:hypothetical protein